MLKILIALQAMHVVFLLLHDWVPLGQLNDTAAVRAANPGGKLLTSTLISTLPFAIGLAGTIAFERTGRPGWIFIYLWISYVTLFVGEIRAWWGPYFFGTDPERVARYREMFGRTHAFLPERHDIIPNTLHVILHVVTLITLIVLGIHTL